MLYALYGAATETGGGASPTDDAFWELTMRILSHPAVLMIGVICGIVCSVGFVAFKTFSKFSPKIEQTVKTMLGDKTITETTIKADSPADLAEGMKASAELQDHYQKLLESHRNLSEDQAQIIDDFRGDLIANRKNTLVLRQRIEKVEDALAVKDEVIASKESEITQKQNQIDDLKDQVRRFREEREGNQAKIKALEATIESLKQTVQKLSEEVALLKETK